MHMRFAFPNGFISVAIGCDDKFEALAESAQQMGRILTCTALWASGKSNAEYGTVLTQY